ncbi:hypothetical protein Ciccas_013797, partial [Cichlidogyrus casuarinus]
GVILIFLFAPFLMLICVGLFTSTGLAEAVVCGPMAEPSRGSTMNLDFIYRFVVNSDGLITRNYAWAQNLQPIDALWRRCANQSMITAFGGARLKLPIDD